MTRVVLPSYQSKFHLYAKLCPIKVARSLANRDGMLLSTFKMHLLKNTLLKKINNVLERLLTNDRQNTQE